MSGFCRHSNKYVKSVRIRCLGRISFRQFLVGRCASHLLPHNRKHSRFTIANSYASLNMRITMGSRPYWLLKKPYCVLRQVKFSRPRHVADHRDQAACTGMYIVFNCPQSASTTGPDSEILYGPEFLLPSTYSCFVLHIFCFYNMYFFLFCTYLPIAYNTWVPILVFFLIFFPFCRSCSFSSQRIPRIKIGILISRRFFPLFK